MGWFHNLSVAKKLLISFSLVAVIAAAIGAAGLAKLATSSELVDLMFHNEVVAMEQLSIIKASSLGNVVELRAMVNSADDAERQRHKDRISAQMKTINAAAKAYEETAMTAEEKEIYKRYVGMRGQLRELRGRAIKQMEAGDRRAALKTLLEVDSTGDDMRGLVDQLIKLNVDAAEAGQGKIEQGLKTARIQIIVLVLGAAAVVLALGVVLGRLIGRPLVRLADDAKRLAQGDVNIDIQTGSKDEVGTATEAFAGVVRMIRDRAATAEQIAQGNINIEAAPLSDADLLGKSYQAMLRSLQVLVEQTRAVARATQDGVLDRRASAEGLEGAYREVVQELNQGVEAVALPLRRSIEHLQKLSRGINGTQLTRAEYKGAYVDLLQGFNGAFAAIARLEEDSKMMVKAAVDGKFDVRADVNQHQGIFRDIMDGVNQTLDGLIKPVQEANRILTQMSRGNLSESMTMECKGDHQQMKEAVNAVHRGLKGLVDYVTRIANGDMTAQWSSVSNEDQISEWFVLLKTNIVTLRRELGVLLDSARSGDMTQRGDEMALRGEYAELLKGVNQVLDVFCNALGRVAQMSEPLSRSAEELNRISQNVGTGAEQTAAQANAVSAGSEQVTRNLQTVSAGGEEMGASIREIAKSTAEASQVANTAVKTAHETNQTIAKLGDSSAEIGQVIKVITSIAQQTNLLALNATIEAARAGEAGKGFAVVANEVKELAKETAKATEDISRKIEAIQIDAKGAVDAIGQITSVIGQINDIQTTIASAIEQQSATTAEIGRNLTEAAKGSTEITRNIGGVAEAAHATSSGALDTQKSAQELERMAAELQELIANFQFSRGAAMPLRHRPSYKETYA